MPCPCTVGSTAMRCTKPRAAAAPEHGVAHDGVVGTDGDPQPVRRRGPAGVGDAVGAEVPERREGAGVDGGDRGPVGPVDAAQRGRGGGQRRQLVEGPLEQVEPGHAAGSRRRRTAAARSAPSAPVTAET